MPFEIREVNQTKVTIVRFESSSSFGVEKSLYEELRNIVSEHLDCDMILNCRGIDRLSSMEIGGIVAAYTELHKNKRKLVLTSVSPRILHLLQVCNLHKVFDILPDEEAALSMLTSSSG